MSGEKHPIRYRPDIDGLRAIAVLAVVLFHAELVRFPAGYMGVDVFFVISGYLITGILLQDTSIIRFYQRRARRILPALFVLLAAILIAGLLMLLPHDLTMLAQTSAATLLFSSNIVFWRMSNYFAHETQVWPLLHTWSLGVEEQFYIVFPLIVRFIPWRGRKIALLFAVLGLISFAIATWLVLHRNATPAFYLVPFRAWELLAGSLLATGAIPPAHRWITRSIAGLIGLAAVILPMIFYTDLGLFPGPGALLPVLGAAVLIWAGSGGKHLASPLLSCKPMIFVGLISYSLYLWHWPVLALARYWAIDPLTPWQALAAVIVSLIVATLSWRFVERPFRKHSVSDRMIWIFAGAGSVILLAVSAVLLWAHGVPGRVSPEVARLNDSSDRTWRCPITSFVRFGPGLACPINLPSRKPEDAEVILWGDSHAQMYSPALARALGDRHGLLVYSYGCAPVSGDASSADCGIAQRANYAAILKMPAQTVILAESWQQYRDEVGIRAGRETTAEERYSDGARRLHDLVIGLRAAHKRVLIVSPIPIPGYDLSSVASRELMFHGAIRHKTSVSLQDFEDDTRNVRNAMIALAKDPGVSLIWVDQMSCVQGRCDYIRDGRSLFADHDHYSTGYAASLWPLFARALDQTAAQGSR